MKKIILLFMLLGMSLLSSCNFQIVDLKWRFKKAEIMMPDGEVKKISIKSWRDFTNSDQIQVVGEDGVVYLVHSSNIVLMSK